MTKGIKNKFFGRNTNESFKKNTNKKLDDDFNIVDKKINKTIRPFYIILVITIIIVANVAIKIYSNAILNYGSKLSFKDLKKMYKAK